MFVKVDMKMSASEYKARNGVLYSTADPYLRLGGDEEQKLEVAQLLEDPKILGTEYIALSKNYVISLNCGNVQVLGIERNRFFKLTTSIPL